MIFSTPIWNEKKEFASHRRFVRDASFAGATILAVPNVSTSREKDKVLTVGEGEFLYEVDHDWEHLPKGHTFGLLKRNGKVFTPIVPNARTETLPPDHRGKSVTQRHCLYRLVQGLQCSRSE
jgi:hypothetical protein